jgi:hypothetical protein
MQREKTTTSEPVTSFMMNTVLIFEEQTLGEGNHA